MPTPSERKQPMRWRRASRLSRRASPRSTSSTSSPQTVRTISGARKKTSSLRVDEVRGIVLLARVIASGLVGLARALSFQAVVAVDVGGMPAAIAEQDQADADGDLGRGDREDHDRQDDARRSARPRAARDRIARTRPG